MRLITRSAFLALAAVCALGVVGLASASAALPEFTVKAPTKFPVAFSGSSGSVRFTEPGGGGTYVCNSSSISGQITGPKEVGKVVVKFSGCEGLYTICNSHKGTQAWETKELSGRIAYISKTGKTVGLLLEPATQLVAGCGSGTEKLGYEEEIVGSILGQISPLNTTETGPFTLADGSWTHFEGEEAIHKLQRINEGSKPKELETVGTTSLTMAHAVGISA
jgi:hypothetical protein